MIILGADYEHTLMLGAPSTPCGPLHYRVTPLSDLYRMILAGEDFEVSEFSLSNYAMFQDRGDMWMTAIPVFPSRAFRHSAIFVRKESSLKTFADLRGKRVGVVDYSMTAAVWLRGVMHDEAGIHWSDIRWTSGNRPRFPVPEQVDYTSVPDDLETLLIDGRLDALVSTQIRDHLQTPADRHLRLLLPAAETAERDYFARTGIFPIMHAVVIHHKTLAKHPQAPAVVFEAYDAAKRSALRRRLGTTFVPWSARHWDDVLTLSGGDPSPYGLGVQNRQTIDTLCRYLKEQHLIIRDMDSMILFPPDGAPLPA